MKYYMHPRIKIKMKEESFQLYIYEDVLDGLKDTEFDPEKVQFSNLLIKKKEVTHIGIV